MGIDYNYRRIGACLDDALGGDCRSIHNDDRPEVAVIGALLDRLRNDDIWFALDEHAEFAHSLDEGSRKRATDAYARFVELTRDIATPSALINWAADRAKMAADNARDAADMVDAMIARAGKA